MLDIQKHKFVLVRILKDIYSNIKISNLLGFKGGTATYLFYGLPRFSVDLDFNLLDNKKESFVFEGIEKILEKYGDIKKKQNKKFTLFFLISYKEEYQNIKVEISKRQFPDSYEIKNYLGIPMLVMKKEDIFAHKLVAILERKQIANRDLFDVWFFMKKGWQFNEDIIKLRTGLESKEYLKKCLRAIKNIKESQILHGLGEVIDRKQKNWLRANLKKELIFLIQYYLKNF